MDFFLEGLFAKLLVVKPNLVGKEKHPASFEQFFGFLLLRALVFNLALVAKSYVDHFSCWRVKTTIDLRFVTVDAQIVIPVIANLLFGAV